MPHLRKRFIIQQFEKLHHFWPVTGVLGLRQVGKSTFLRDLLHLPNFVTLDDEDVREEAEASAKVFLGKLQKPCIIDEIQKVPKLFDAIKSTVDKKRIPGQWIVTGSVLFQSLAAVRESLTGRIGLIFLHPMTFAELYKLDFRPIKNILASKQIPRISITDFSLQLGAGGLPVPAFMRDVNHQQLYFKSWLNTLLLQDAARVHGRAYDADLGMQILQKMGQVLCRGEHPQLTSFKVHARTLKKYLHTFETLFLLRRFSVHEAGVGKDFWLPTDAGFAHYLMHYASGAETNLSLARIAVLNEIMANQEYQGNTLSPIYYKSQHGSVVDFVWHNTPIMIIAENIATSKTGWIEKPLLGAMKKLNAKQGIIVAPIDRPHIEKTGISIVPWSYWS